MHTYSSQYREAGWVKEIKNWTAVNSTCQGKLSACHFGHACHRFISPVLEVLIFFSFCFKIFGSNEANMRGVGKLVV
jgi:hypothetical protein